MYNNVSQVMLDFEVDYVNDRSMSMLIETATGSIYFDQLPRGKFKHIIEIQFPTTVKITVSGKTAQDTVVDADGDIVGDTYIKLVNVTVDRMPCFMDYLHNLTLGTESGDFIKTCYWGFNGTVDINFSEKNSFFWALANSQFG